jgi:hypothetical protein
MARNKFIQLHENYMKRFERGGFLVGDVFKFNDNFKRSDGYKSLGKATQDRIDDMIDSGKHIRVVNIKDTTSPRYPASSDTSSMGVVLDIALDTGGGRYTDYTSVPGELGQAVQYAPNLLPIPDEMRRDSEVIIKPEEAEETKAPGAVDYPTRDLPKQNTVIPSDPVTPSPAVTAYTNKYLADLN